MKRILVTGGAGFLGSHLVERLLADGNEVTCLDNFYTGSMSNLRGVLKDPNFRLVSQDVTLSISGTFDQIYNLACPASPIQYQRDPIKTLQTSVLGAINTLQVAHQNNARILQASTSEIYGDPDVHPQPEGYWGKVNPIGIRSCYDEGKRSAETLFFDYFRKYNTEIKVARIFNTYGPRMQKDDGRVVSNFIVQALKDEDITIYGDGKQTRSFCYVDDLITGLVNFMNLNAEVRGPMNLGNSNEFTILELAERVISLSNSNSRIVLRPLPEDDPKQRKPDLGLAIAEIGWEPIVELQEGLTRTINYFQLNMND